MNRLRLADLSAVHLEDSGEVEVVGFLVWYSISSQLVERDSLERMCVEAGLDTGFMPPPIRVPDAFRRATKAIETRRNMGEGVVHRFLVREVVSGKEKIQRQIVREVVNSKDERLSYQTQEAILILDREDGLMSYSIINDEVQELVAEASRLFEIYRSHYDGNALRTMVLNIIKSMSPISMRERGAVYFIPAKYNDRLQALLRFLTLLGEAEGHAIPMINTLENLELIRKEAVRTVNDTFTKLKDAVEDPEIKSNEISNLIEETGLTLRIVEDYREILMGDLNNLDKSALAFQKMIRELDSKRKRGRRTTEGATRLIRA